MTTPRQPVVELVQSAFPPLVAALVSPQAEAACRKNNLSFVEMLQPFCSLPAEGISQLIFCLALLLLCLMFYICPAYIHSSDDSVNIFQDSEILISTKC
jgi:hypothetical protein